jgi:hypothetical protein
MTFTIVPGRASLKEQALLEASGAFEPGVLGLGRTCTDLVNGMERGSCPQEVAALGKAGVGKAEWPK